jgi:sugar diacid utilization regulator
MGPSARAGSLGTVLAEIGPAATLMTGDETQLDRPVRGAVVWLAGDPVPDDPAMLIVCPGLGAGSDLKPFKRLLAEPEPRMIALTSPSMLADDRIREIAGSHLLIDAGTAANAAEVVLSVARATQTAEESASRRLSSLQRALNRALAEPEPIPAVMARLKQVCNATAALVDMRGQAVHTTGPVPLVLLFGEVARTSADSQMLDIDGWRGVAARLEDPSSADAPYGWLLVTARRPDFPDSYIVSAVHVAASLVEASLRMAAVSRRQERAVRAAVFEQALALRLERHDAELAGKVAGLGISFEEELRTVVIRPARSTAGRRRLVLEDFAETIGQALRSADVAHLMTIRDNCIAILGQCSTSMIRRLVAREGQRWPSMHVGVGRRIAAVGGIVDSYNDAQLAVRTLRQRPRPSNVMSYEDFDFAARLFADVGLEKMAAWAEDFMRPLEGRELLLEGLERYFEHDQNINTAADSLNIHHNSLRYRIAQVASLLGINLKDPAGVSSAFLALTALSLTRSQAPRIHAGGPGRVTDAEAPTATTEFAQRGFEEPGVVYGPER